MPTSALGFVKPPIIKPFTLPDRTRRGIAAALGLPALPNIVARYIEGEIEVLKATSASVQPTIGDVQATIDDATKILSRANRALAPFTHPWSGIDHESLDELAPLAQQITEAIAAFRDAAASRSRALGKMRRLGPANRPLGQLCLILRLIFEAVQEALGSNAWSSAQLHAFMYAVLEAAGIDCESYRSNPARLDALMELGKDFPAVRGVLASAFRSR
jgi:hypothetical protein